MEVIINNCKFEFTGEKFFVKNSNLFVYFAKIIGLPTNSNSMKKLYFNKLIIGQKISGEEIKAFESYCIDVVRVGHIIGLAFDKKLKQIRG